jgi:hypothetical protein
MSDDPLDSANLAHDHAVLAAMEKERFHAKARTNAPLWSGRSSALDPPARTPLGAPLGSCE